MKLVSIIVPVYQVADYLRKCIYSILNQTYDNIEVILVDDGSTDGSGEICDEIAKLDERIKVYHKCNEGLSSARNLGIDVSRGEYLAFVDSDDWISENYIMYMYNVCEEQACDICQCGYYDVIDDKGKKTDILCNPILYNSNEFLHAEYRLLQVENVIACNKLYSASLFEEIRFPQGRIHEDEFTIYKVISKAEKIALISTKLYYYRYRETSITNCDYTYKRLDSGEAFEEKEKFFKKIGEKELVLSTKLMHYQWLEEQIKHFPDVKNRDYELENTIKNDYIRLDRELGREYILSKKIRRDYFVFPFDQVTINSSIVIYGGGRVGKQFFLQVHALNYCNILKWVDRNYVNLRKQGIPVEDINVIDTVKAECDYFIIAINNKSEAVQIINELTSKYGIQKEKIVYGINAVVNV